MSCERAFEMPIGVATPGGDFVKANKRDMRRLGCLCPSCTTWRGDRMSSRWQRGLQWLAARQPLMEQGGGRGGQEYGEVATGVTRGDSVY